MKIKSGIVAALFVLATACGGGDGGTTGNTENQQNQENQENSNPTSLTLNPIGNRIVMVGTNINFTLSASNPNGGSLSYTASVVDGSADPFNAASGNNATFNLSENATFNWTPMAVDVDSYELQFTVQNTSDETDSDTITISVRTQFEIGEANFNDRCRSCHRVGGTGHLLQCEQSTVYYPAINSGSMATHASGWTNEVKDAVFFYLQNVEPC
ncbi:MAG: hypothetical protein OEY00_00985 [Gammaproteobacteria bacterium]|nr:hypothetical protein [Gammaproteobacteria bacterium]